ncbi:hypothetical protein BJ973_004057 [Actinoplanes tereljensis]|uniref:Uncharacterized protein n=1 Tax=Paractinoplanes tereljensis TaxID=571912 RepID=A0A919NQV5_9ACTN|nr:DUF6345 domain-containing protein [Actinoplanes tereljensis]GIF23446.1 hypothetical protein Ate02nite_61760 [Actinoplanes tereljensis]
MRFSTGAVRDYVRKRCGGPDLPLTIDEARAFRAWYELAGHAAVTTWENGDVWGSDFRDGGDNDPSGGSELPDIYFFTGHGICQSQPTATSPDFLLVCGNFGKPNRVNIGLQSRWGNAPGNLQFLFLDASCPMDLISISNDWFPVFRGLHVATGNSGTNSQDTLDSSNRGSQFAARTAGLPGWLEWLFPQESVGNAWMHTGTIDVQSGCSAVVIAAGRDRDEAIDRRENERITDGRPDPVPNWFAWRWRTA